MRQQQLILSIVVATLSCSDSGSNSPGADAAVSRDVAPDAIAGEDAFVAPDIAAPDVAAPDVMSADAPTSGPVGEVIARDQMGPFGIALDATHVYWTNLNGGGVFRMPKAGGAPETLATGAAAAIGVHEGYVYWTGSNHSLHRRPVAGGTSQELSRLPTAGSQVTAFLALTSRYAVWGGGVQIGYISLDGSGMRYLAPLPCNACGATNLTADEAHIYWSRPSEIARAAFGSMRPERVAIGGGLGLVVDGANVYWGTHGAREIQRAPLAGGTAATVAAGAGYPEHLARDATHVYWTEGSRSALVRRAPLAGGAAQVVAVAAVGAPWRLAVDDTHVYWTDSMGGTLGRAPKAPASP